MMRWCCEKCQFNCRDAEDLLIHLFHTHKLSVKDIEIHRGGDMGTNMEYFFLPDGSKVGAHRNLK